MTDYYSDRARSIVSANRVLPEYGVTPEANPGEGIAMQNPDTNNMAPQARTGAAQARNLPAHDVGSQVGVMRNLEYSAGGRSHRISMGPYTSA